MGNLLSIFKKEELVSDDKVNSTNAINEILLSFKDKRIFILSEQETLLLEGVLGKVNSDNIVINRKVGQFSLPFLSVGLNVFIQVVNDDLKTSYFTGNIVDSNRLSCTVNNIKESSHQSKRGSFRLEKHIPIQVYLEEDTRMKTPDNCNLVDISIEGACIESEYLYGESEIIRLKIKLDEYAVKTFVGQIMWSKEVSRGKFHYGILFAKLTEDETESLRRQIFNIQIDNKKEHSRTKEGYWV